MGGVNWENKNQTKQFQTASHSQANDVIITDVAVGLLMGRAEKGRSEDVSSEVTPASWEEASLGKSWGGTGSVSSVGRGLGCPRNLDEAGASGPTLGSCTST